jgi:predicted O-linked N-acetylglucosamine transferase (SPINDLY family)
VSTEEFVADPQSLYQLAGQLYGQKNYQKAIGALFQLRNQQGFQIRAYRNIGACLFSLHRFRSAERVLTRAIRLDPADAASHTNLANTLCEMAELDRAERHYGLALERDPDNLEVLSNLGLLQILQERTSEAKDTLNRCLELKPNHAESHSRLGLAFEAEKNLPDAIRCLEKAIQLDPGIARYHHALGAVLNSQGKNRTRALVCFERAAELNPKAFQSLSAAGHACLSSSRPMQALDYYRRAVERDASNLGLRMDYRLVTPIIPRSRKQFNFYRARSIQGLDSIERMLPDFQRTTTELIPHLFFLAYQNNDNRRLLEAYWRLVAHSLDIKPELRGQQRSSRPRGGCDGRIRIGFISDYFYSHSNTRAFEGLIKHLDRSCFEVVVIHGFGSSNDVVRQTINTYAHTTLELSRKEPRAAVVQKLKDLELDILFFTDIGMSIPTSSLALHRIAPVQFTGWGIPHTTGIPSLDYYVSSSLAEPPGAQSQYTETLIELRALPCCYLSEQLELHDVPRDYFFLPPGVPLFGCLQSLFKLHPDMDALLERLAIENPTAGFVFVDTPQQNQTAEFVRRLKKNAPTVMKQIVFLSIMNRKQFIALSHCLDLLLDPPYYGSGITFYESSFVGTPVVTLEGTYLRNRLVAAAYRHMGITDPPIATSFDEYVRIASGLIQDKPRLAALTEEIRTKASENLYDDLTYVRSFEEFCKQACSDSPPRRASD